MPERREFPFGEYCAIIGRGGRFVYLPLLITMRDEPFDLAATEMEKVSKPNASPHYVITTKNRYVNSN